MMLKLKITKLIKADDPVNLEEVMLWAMPVATPYSHTGSANL